MRHCIRGLYQKRACACVLGILGACLPLTGGCTLKLSFDDQQNPGRSAALAENSASVNRLRQLLTSADPQVRAIAAVELGGMGPKARDAVPHLAQPVSHPPRHSPFL